MNGKSNITRFLVAEALNLLKTLLGTVLHGNIKTYYNVYIGKFLDVRPCSSSYRHVHPHFYYLCLFLYKDLLMYKPSLYIRTNASA